MQAVFVSRAHRTTKPCNTCGTIITRLTCTGIKAPWYCNRKCARASQKRSRHTFSCVQCARHFEAKRSSGRKYCTQACYIEAKRSKSAVVPGLTYKGRLVLTDSDNRGYLRVMGGKMLHRVLMQDHLGRKLQPNEHVHHINGVKSDNRIENLAVVDWSEHAGITSRSNARQRATDKARLRKYEELYGPLPGEQIDTRAES